METYVFSFVRFCVIIGALVLVCSSQHLDCTSADCDIMSRPCLTERSAALKQASALAIGGKVFVPECLDDGRFSPVQCHSKSGVCWCVTQTGAVIPGTTSSHSRPHCLSVDAKDSTASGSRRKLCSASERLQFNKNLLLAFKEEYERRIGRAKSLSVFYDAVLEKKILRWKFDQLNRVNSSEEVLTSDEFRGLLQLIRKIIKPRRCAVSFRFVCDSNRDRVISWPEWADCVRTNGRQSAQPREDHQETVSKTLNRVKTTVASPLPTSMTPAALNGGQIVSFSPSNLRMLGDSARRNQAPGRERSAVIANNCGLDREDKMERQRLGDFDGYIPECELLNERRYERIQCFHGLGYCWCVDQSSGRPIPNTSALNKKPECEKAPVTYEVMKGCATVKKKIFLRNMFRILADLKTSEGDETLPGNHTQEYILANWQFDILDADKNGFMDRKGEWKSFRRWAKEYPELKRCGRRLPLHCDHNKDKKISLDEWLYCLEVTGQRREADSIGEDPLARLLQKKKSAGRGRKRKGQRKKKKNPFTSILRTDY